jgi:Family of unknown function (DUF5677)
MTKIIDMTVPASPKAVPGHLADLSSKCVALANRIRERLPRSDQSIALANFCMYVGGELKQMSRFYPDNVPGLVWCARNLFEVNLIVRYVLASEGNFRTWLGQALQDEKEYIEGALAVAEQGSEQLQVQLRSRLAELDKLALRHQLDFSKAFRVPSLAKDLGMEAEYTGLYKLFSKYVHPSSLLINGWYSQKPDVAWLDVFLVKAQIYAGDAVSRLSAACGLPA